MTNIPQSEIEVCLQCAGFGVHAYDRRLGLVPYQHKDFATPGIILRCCACRGTGFVESTQTNSRIAENLSIERTEPPPVSGTIENAK